MKKRLLSIVLCLSLFVATFATSMVVSAAADIDATTGECANIADYRGDNAATPTKANKVFAGWYKDAEFTEAIKPSVTSGKAYAKFVDPALFTVKNQFNEGAHKTSATVDLRIITTVDTEWYAGFEFEVTIAGLGTATLPVDTIYTSLVGYEPDDLNADANYFVVEKITEIPAAYFNAEISITPKYTTYDGTVITGTTRGTVEEKFILKENLELGATELSVRAGSDAGVLFMDWGEVTDEIPNGIAWGTSEGTWIEGGVYWNGDTQPAWVRLYKNGCHYMVFSDMGWTVSDGVSVKIAGTYRHSNGAMIKIAPVTFVYSSYHKAWYKDGEMPEVPDVSTISWYSGHVSSYDKNMFFFSITPGDDLYFASPGTIYWSSWADFRLTQPGGTMQGLNQQLIKWASDQYYLILPAAQPTGTILQIQGTLTDSYIGGGGHDVTFAPATFELQEDGSWELISTEPF